MRELGGQDIRKLHGISGDGGIVEITALVDENTCRRRRMLPQICAGIPLRNDWFLVIQGLAKTADFQSFIYPGVRGKRVPFKTYPLIPRSTSVQWREYSQQSP